MKRRSAHDLRVEYENLSPEDRAEVTGFVHMIQTSQTERDVWVAVLRSLVQDFRRAERDDAADDLELVLASALELLSDIDKAKANLPQEVVQ